VSEEEGSEIGVCGVEWVPLEIGCRTLDSFRGATPLTGLGGPTRLGLA